MKHRWRRFLAFLGLVGPFDYDPPFAPDSPHRFEQHASAQYCTHCGGGFRHEIHREPWDPRRMKQILEDSVDPVEENKQTLARWQAEHRDTFEQAQAEKQV